MNTKILILALCAAMRAASVAAQPLPPEGTADPENVRMRIGPVMLNPSVALTNFGVDNNVFNETENQNPKQDLTFTVTPATDIWLRAGPTWFTANVREDLVWYQQYSSERAANTFYNGAWKVPFSRVVLKFGGSYLNARERPGYEIDSRVRRSEAGYNGAVEVRVLSKTSLVVNASRLRVDYDDEATFQGATLEDELNRTSTTFGGGLKYQATPLTAFSLTASRVEDRFQFSPLRDSDSTTVALQVSLDPAALIKGSATLGYRDFKPLVSSVEPYDGFTASANLSYVLLGSTRFGFIGTRDVQYSYDVNQPYYILSGIDLSIAQQVFGPIDVVGRFGRQKLAYRDRAAAPVAVVDRIDYVHSYGGGVGYHIGPDWRLGFNIDHIERDSDLLEHRYQNLRYGISVTYGL
jgi:hypothetical protein